MIIGDFVEAVITSGTTGGSTPPKPSSQGGVKDWIKSAFFITVFIIITMHWCGFILS